MTVAVNTTPTTNVVCEGGTSNGSHTLAKPSSSTTDDIIILMRHHSAGSVGFSSGSTDGTLGSTYLATGSTSSMVSYRRMTSASDQSSGWAWSSSGSSWTHAAIRFTGCDTSGNPFVGGTNNGGSTAGDFIMGSGTSITLTVGNGDVGDMGVVFCTSTASVSSVTSGWTAVSLGTTQRHTTLIYKSYSSVVTGDTCTVTFSATASALGRHGILNVLPSSPNATVTPSAVAATVAFPTPAITSSGFYRVTVVGDSLTEGTQVGVGNRWVDLLFGSQGTITNGVWWDGASSGVPFPNKRIYSATYQGDSVIETTNRAYTNAKTDMSTDALGRATDLMIIMFGANDELDAIPGGITQATNNTSSSSTDSMQWFEDNIVQLANGGIQSGTVGANPGNVNNLPKPKFVLVVGEWAWRSDSIPTAGVAGNPSNHSWLLSRLQDGVTAISALPHVQWAGYVDMATHASLGKKADNSGYGTNTAQCPTGGYGYDGVHASVSGQANVYAPAIRYGIEKMLSETGAGLRTWVPKITIS